MLPPELSETGHLACPMCATCSRRSPPSSVRTFPMLITSPTRDGSLAWPCSWTSLNVKLQGKEILVTDMHAHITAFQVKLHLWEAQLAIGQFVHFPRFSACVPDNMDLDTCISIIASLREEFASCYTDVKVLAADFKLFTAPFDLPVDNAPASLQMELVEL